METLTKLGVYEKAPIEEFGESTGKAPVGVR
jgi:hypothetical protein